MAKATTQTIFQPLTPIESAQKQLEAVRSKMQKAKIDHEANLARARELRELFSKAEKVTISSDYEDLANQEAVLSSKINQLQAQAEFEHAKRAPVGTR